MSKKAQAQAIAHAQGVDIAPTPQNTPLQATPGGLSRPQVPNTISEDAESDEGDDIPTIGSNQVRDDIRSQLAGNPLLAQMVQGKLAGLIGKSSGYIESLPPSVRQRVEGLKGLQVEHTKIEAEFQKAILELEKQFAEKYRPIYERRRKIIEGEIEPTEDEIKAGFKVDEDDEDSEEEEAEPKKVLSAAELGKGPKGIPEFWLTALSNHAGISELITDRDTEALKHLVDVRVEYLESGKPGFKLLFEFGSKAKDFFEDKILTKTYYYQEEVGSLGDFIYDHAEGTEIKWKTGKDLTVKVETKKQRNKHTNQTRTVKKVVPTDSFFAFFKPPQPPAGDDEDESALDDDIDEKLELDYQIGEDIKDRIVPHAVDYFTGKALEQDLDDEFSEDEFDDEDDFDDQDQEDDDDDDEVSGGKPIKGARKAAQPPQSGVTPGSAQDPQECKNQ